MIKARVYRSSQREFECKVIATGEFVSATAMGKLLKGKDHQIVVGDFVTLEETNDDPKYKIIEIDKRYGEVFRVIVREASKKVTASNIDLLIITTSVSEPVYKRGIIDRFLVRAYQWNIKPTIVFNKMDEYDPESFDIKFERDRLSVLGIECFEMSALDDTYKKKYLELGKDELMTVLRGKTALFLGQSGVGKSQIITSLSNKKFELKTGGVGKWGKGTHTTSWSEIIDLDNFLVVDSPGVRSLSLEDLPSEDFISYFPDLVDMSVQCKFQNCTHMENAKGCAFRDKLDPDNYDDALVLSRLDSFIRIFDELSQIPEWANRITGKRS